jgi:hypothetical protein
MVCPDSCASQHRTSKLSDGAGKLAPHSEAPSSAPEVNDPVAPGEFTSLPRVMLPGGRRETTTQGVPDLKAQWIELHYGKQNPNWDPASVNLTGTA